MTNSKTGYWMIIIGILLLTFNLGYLNLTLLVQRGALPVSLIIVGLVELFFHFFNLGSLGEVIKGFAGLFLVIIIFANFGVLFTRLITPSYMLWEFNENDALFSVNGTSFSTSFTDMNLHTINNNLIVEYYNSSDSLVSRVESFQSNKEYSFVNNFGDYNLSFNNLLGGNNSLKIGNDFASTELKGLNVFDSIVLDSNFGSLKVHTGSLTGNKLIRVTNSFGSVNVYVDKQASYLIETSNTLGSVNNYIGLESKDYNTAVNKVHLIVDNSFGSVNLYSE